MIILTNNDQMGKNILYLRRKNNMSQHTFARLVGIDDDTLDAIEQGVQLEIDAQITDKICQMFGINISILMEDFMEI